jgi:hypothetical protein
MLRPAKVLLSCLIVAVALLASFTTASARTFSQSSATFRATWAPMSIIDREAVEATVRCNVTVEGSFHARTFAKVRGSLIGYVTRAGLTACTGGSARFLSETLPWHVAYESFAGALPNITRLNLTLIGAGISVDPEGFPPSCLARAEAVGPIVVFGAFAAGLIVGYVWGRLSAEELQCGFGHLEFAGEGAVTVLNSTARITVRLI